MKHTQKMVLIPEEEYQHLTKSKDPFKEDMKDILKERRDHEAATKMSQLVGSYLRHKQAAESSKEKKKDINFIDHFKPLYHNKVSSFIKHLHDNSIKWTDNKELILPTGQIIPQSNIIDLITEALVQSPKRKTGDILPIGWNAFVTSIANSTIPKSFFGKKSTQAAISQLPSAQDEWEMY